MGAFDFRSNVRLELILSQAPNESVNWSTVYWTLQLRETAQQPTFVLDAINTASLSFTLAAGTSLNYGTLTPSIGNFAYDFRPTNLQTLVIGSGEFGVNHTADGFGGLVTGNASCAAPSSGNGLGLATESASIELLNFNRSPVFTSVNTPSPAFTGVPYSGNFTAIRSAGVSVFSGDLPTGLSINSSTGNITGTPTTVGSFTFTIRAEGAFEGSADETRTIVVNPRTPVFTDLDLGSPAIRGASYSNAVSATETDSYSRSGTIPPGLTFNSNGTITGTPTTLGSFSFTVFATNITGTASAGVTLRIDRPTPVYTDNTVSSSATLGLAYSDGVAATDATNYAINSGSLPAGLSLNASTGAITGTPTAVGTFTFVIRASNETGGVNTPSRTITVISPIRINTATGPTASFVTGIVRVNTATGPTASFVNGVTRVWNGTAFVPARLT